MAGTKKRREREQERRRLGLPAIPGPCPRGCILTKSGYVQVNGSAYDPAARKKEKSRRYQSGGARRPQRYVRLSASFATSMIQVSKARRRNAALATDSVTVGGERARLDFGGSLRRKAAGPESPRRNAVG